MHNRGLIIVGGGGHATVVAEAAALSDWALDGFYDDSPEPALSQWASALRALGGRWERFELNHRGRLEELNATTIGGNDWIIAVGDLRLRRALIGRLHAAKTVAACVIHAAASVSPTAEVGSGVFVGPRAVIHPRARVGAHAIVNTAAVVEHDCEVGENSHIAPGAILGGGVRVAEDVLIGLGSRVLPTLRIGRGAVVGAGAVVVRDIAPGEVVVGMPASPLRS